MILFATALKLSLHCNQQRRRQQEQEPAAAADASADGHLADTDFEFEADGSFRAHGPHAHAPPGDDDEEGRKLLLSASYVSPEGSPGVAAQAEAQAHPRPRFPGIALHIDLPGVTLADWQSPDGLLGGPWEPSSVMVRRPGLRRSLPPSSGRLSTFSPASADASQDVPPRHQRPVRRHGRAPLGHRGAVCVRAAVPEVRPPATALPPRRGRIASLSAPLGNARHLNALLLDCPSGLG